MAGAKKAGAAPAHKASIYDVARAAEVSVSTVSRFLAGFRGIAPATRGRIDRAIRRLGFRPSPLARSLASRFKNSVGLVVSPGSRAYSDFFLSEILAGVTGEAGRRGWSVHVTMPTHEQDSPLLLDRHSDLVDGSLILDVSLDLACVKALIGRGHPAVIINHHHASLPSVSVDNIQGARLAARHLVRLGHRRIACITGAGAVGAERARGYRQELRASGLAPMGVSECGVFLPELARRAARDFLRAPHPPTAILVSSDWMAAGVLAEFSSAGIAVPGDVSVVGFDDAIIAEATQPLLTTVRQPLAELGAAAFSLLHARLTGLAGEGARKLEPELVIRNSTAAIPVRRARREETRREKMAS